MVQNTCMPIVSIKFASDPEHIHFQMAYCLKMFDYNDRGSLYIEFD